jgi:hypothetical protein
VIQAPIIQAHAAEWRYLLAASICAISAGVNLISGTFTISAS